MQSQQNQTGTLEDSTEQETTSFTLFITSQDLQFKVDVPLAHKDELIVLIHEALTEREAVLISSNSEVYIIPYKVLSNSIIELLQWN